MCQFEFRYLLKLCRFGAEFCHFRKRDKRRDFGRAIAVATMLFGAPSLALAQSGADTTLSLDEANRFGDIFVHPRDSRYLPEKAPSRAEFHEFRLQDLDGRGDVGVWEYRKGNRIITRELWLDENGSKRSSIKIGRKF